MRPLKWSFGCSISLASVWLCAGGVVAPAAAATVDCSKGQTISAALAKLKPATGYITVNVSGACSDNVYIPPALAVSLIGAKGASLVPANANTPTMEADGRLFMQTMSVTGGSFTAVFVNRGGFATLVADQLSGPGTGLQVSDNSGALVQNSTINVTGYSAINTYATGVVEVDGVTPVNGATGTTITGGQVGIACNQGSVTLNASGGPISVMGSASQGIYVSGCTFNSYVSNGATIAVQNNKGDGILVGAAGSGKLAGVQILNNGGDGLHATENSGVEIGGGLTIAGNAGVAVEADQNASVNFNNYAGVNTITEPKSDTDVLFGCYQSGKIFVNQISGFITPAPNGTNQGCLQIGGP